MPRIRTDMAAVYVFRMRSSAPEFLIVRRAAGESYGGTWQTVYGLIEPFEPAWRAALRELREETGLVPARFFSVNTMEGFYVASEDTIYHCVNFAAEVAPDARVGLNDEHDAHEWLEPDAAIARLTWPGQRRAVREILDEIVTPGPATDYLRISMDTER